jgi:hypothetical protein
MSENPYEPPQELNEAHSRRFSVAFWAWALVTAIAWPAVGAVLGLFAFLAVAFSMSVTGLSWHVYVGSGPH